MADILPIIGALVVLAGAVFMVLAAIGIIRMPDPYNRIQAGTKATTLGLILVLTGMIFYHPEWVWKIIVLIFFILLTNPVSSHALAKAAHKCGAKMTDDTVIDQLDELSQQDEKNHV